MQKALLTSCAACLILAGAWFSRGQDSTSAPVDIVKPIEAFSDQIPAQTQVKKERTETEKAIAEKRPLKSGQPETFRYLSRTAPPAVDQDGHLILSVFVRHYFDLFLLDHGKETQDVILKRLRLVLQKDLKDPALSEALDLLKDYMGYMSHVAQYAAHNNRPGDLEAAKYALRVKREARSLFFTPQESKAFFQFEDAREDYAFALKKVRSNDELSDEEKRKAEENLMSYYSDLVVAQSGAHEEPNDNRSTYKNLDRKDSSRADIYAERRHLYGDETAKKLEAIDAKRQDFQDRLTTYREAVKSETAYMQQDSQTYQDTVKRLREVHFDGAELRRVQALDAEKAVR